MVVATPWAAFKDGWRRVRRAPLVVGCLWLASVLLALLPPVSSPAAAVVTFGVGPEEWNALLTPSIVQMWVPAAAHLLSAWTSPVVASTWALPILAGILARLVFSLFLLGGSVDRLARDRREGPAAFLTACRIYLPRLVRASLLVSAAYGAALFWWYPWLTMSVQPVWEQTATGDVAQWLIRLAISLVFALPLLLLNLLCDYATVRLVVEDRRSAIGAFVAAARFLRRHAAAALALHLLNSGLLAVLLALYFTLVSDAPVGSPGVATLLLHVYTAMRVTAGLAFLGSEVALFQARLGQPGYVART